MNKWHLIIDVLKCIDCNNCFLACKDEFVDNDFPPYSIAQVKHIHRWINIMRKERGRFPTIDVAFLPIPCQHCDNARCIQNSSNGAVYKTDDGIVIIDPQKAKGQKDIVDSCPYGAVWWNEEKNVAQKCTMCAHLLADGWKEPRCVTVCPTGAMRVINTDDATMNQIINDESLEVLHPEYGTSPSVYYGNLYRYFKCFIGGCVAFETNGITDCAEGAVVTLLKDKKEIDRAVTDNYGDFKFDNLEENSGRYELEISYKNHEKKTLEFYLKTSINIGTILI